MRDRLTTRTQCEEAVMWWKLVFGVLCCILADSKGDIRCYCNLPLCVVTGYMCKSALNICYTERSSYSSDVSRSRHGCVELLRHEKRDECSKGSSTPITNAIPSVLCCTNDMCNYVNSLDINIQVRTRSNSSRVAGVYGYGDSTAAGREAALQQDVWFRAAVIAVPIAGTFILILLVLLAMRMLRQDSKRHRQFLEMRRQRKMLLGDQRREKAVQLYLPAPGWNKDYVYEKPINPSFLLWTKWTPEKQPEFL